MEYKNRIADDLLTRKLESSGAVLIEGAKWCGKTTTAEQQAQSILYMDDPENMAHNIELSKLSPRHLLEGDTPRLIDEWQLAPYLWDSIRYTIDRRNRFGQFILTGSAVPADLSSLHHSGTGRFSWLRMRPMTLFESNDSTGEVSLKNLFSTPDQIFGQNQLDLHRIAYLICRGGWPMTLNMREEVATDTAYNYYDAIVNTDISRVDGVSRSSDRTRRILRSYAWAQGSQMSLNAMRKDLVANETDTFDIDTLSSYIEALKKIFVIEDAPAWNPNLRSKASIRTSDTRYFTDPSMASASLGAGPEDLINDLETMGFLFETLCMRDLRVYAEAIGGTVYHYKDSYGLESDAVIHLRNGSYGLVEIKIGGDKAIREGITLLQKVTEAIDETRMGTPSFKMVLTGVGSYAFRSKEGTYIVPIGCLKH
ncbi:MAG TPA: ATP-binding protein [Bacteroidales bacterium]|jgi:predicted AAA+ superfamily ATPase|nr:ATP-binding protein [Bacteroidales bacterium]